MAGSCHPAILPSTGVACRARGWFGLTGGRGALIGPLVFIIWNGVRDSRASRFGTFILFFVLVFGIFGFAMKSVIQWLLGI